jgi:hypothetical protein
MPGKGFKSITVSAGVYEWYYQCYLLREPYYEKLSFEKWFEMMMLKRLDEREKLIRFATKLKL